MEFVYNLATQEVTTTQASNDVWSTGGNFGLTLTGLNGSKDLSNFSVEVFIRAKGLLLSKTIPEAGSVGLKLSKTNTARVWSERLSWSDPETDNILAGLRLTDGATLAEVNLGPATARDTANFDPDLSAITVISATESGKAATHQPSYFPSVVDVSGLSEFNGVTNASGERLNYLLYTSTDHTDGDGGIYLSLGFGDPITGTWKRYDAALADGDLDNFGGTKPTATGGRVFQYNSQCETPWVGKVGSTWVMTFHPRWVDDVQSPWKQRTMRATSASPFGSFTITDYGSTEAFLVNDTSDASVAHTGYAVWMPMPANSSISGDFYIHSLFQGGASASNAVWSANSSMDSPNYEGATYGVSLASIYVPDYEKLEGVEAFDGTKLTHVEYDGAKFMALSTCGTAAFGENLRWSGVYKVAVELDMRGLSDRDLVLAPGDLWLLKGADDTFLNITSFEVPQIRDRPSGGKVLFVGAQGDVAADEEYVIVMPITVSV